MRPKKTRRIQCEPEERCFRPRCKPPSKLGGVSLSMDEFEQTMDGVYTTSVRQGTLDEAPMAYKPMQEIIDATGDTMEIIDILKPIYNFKS